MPFEWNNNNKKISPHCKWVIVERFELHMETVLFMKVQATPEAEKNIEFMLHRELQLYIQSPNELTKTITALGWNWTHGCQLIFLLKLLKMKLHIKKTHFIYPTPQSTFQQFKEIRGSVYFQYQLIQHCPLCKWRSARSCLYLYNTASVINSIIWISYSLICSTIQKI